MKRSVEILLLFYILGVVAGPVIRLDTLSAILLLLAALFAATINETAAWRKSSVYLFLSFFFLGVSIFSWNAETNKGNIDYLAGTHVILRGTIVKEPDIRLNAVNYTVRVEQVVPQALNNPPKGLILLAVKGSSEKFSYGDRLEVRGTPNRPEQPGNPGEFNYRKYLEQKGIRLIINSGEGAGLRKIGTGNSNPVVNTVISIKRRCVSILNQTLSPTNAAIMEGVLFGSTGRINSDTRNDFALTGVIHILSVSGYHMALLVGAIVYLAKVTGLRNTTSACLTIFITAAYALMTGGNPPVFRALIMAWIIVLARITGRKYDWSASLSAAAFVILVLDPVVIYQPGFQLSFCATWGIFYFTPLVERVLPFNPWLKKAMAATIAAQLAVIPLMAWYFSYIPLISVFANLIIVPLVSLSMMLGSFGVIVGLIWPPLAMVVNVSTNLLIDLVLWFTHFLASVPLAGITVKQPSVLDIFVFYILLLLMKFLVSNREASVRLRKIWMFNRAACLTICLIAITALLWFGIIFPQRGKLELTFLDIGQGDAALLEMPSGKVVLIDTGGIQGGSHTSFDPGEKVLVPYLKRQGITRIDLLILTHPHADHIQGAVALSKYARIRLLVVSPHFKSYPDGVRTLELIRKGGTEIKEAAGGDKLWLDENIYLDVISPLRETVAEENNNSLVMKLSYQDFSVLFTGDAEQPVLDKLWRNFPNLRADIVKIPHHGSRNAWVPGFFRNLKATLAVISVGAHNYFGHPSREVLAGLSEIEVPVVRTDLNGAVIIQSDGHTYDITTGKGMD